MEKGERINNTQFYHLITGDELSWQSIIYDLIKTEQLNPWDINLSVLADKYLEAVESLEDGDFMVSSKVLLACSLLLRLKTEILANSYIAELNDVLFGKKESQRTLDIEKFIINEGDLPLLIPKSPMARHKKVTLDQLMVALNHAMNTESRRIKRTIKTHQAQRSINTVLPRDRFIPLKVRVKKIVDVITGHFSMGKKELKFHHLAPGEEERLAAFLPVLHLANDSHVHLHQPVHFEDIYITKDIHPDDHVISLAQLEAYGPDEIEA
ncbi:MAG: segregation and condensation protein A [Patescibacteria group bacterium]|jgi:segregation and condensation protein A